MQSWRQGKAAFWTVLLPPAVWLTLLFVIPLGMVWLFSFGENSGMTGIAITGTFKNYAKAFEPLYLQIFWKSIWIAGLTTLVCLIVGFPVAMLITFASERMKPWLLLLIMLPFWTNLLIRTYALKAVLGQDGYINSSAGWIARHLGADFQPWPLLFNNFAVIFGLIYVHLPFTVLPLYAALDRLNKQLIEASLDLGAGHFRTLFSIIIPLAKPGIISAIMITFVPALGSYLTPALLGGTDSQLIANVIERQFKAANNWPFGAALSFILLYATFIGLALQSLFSRQNTEAAVA
jgi:spermidine/putrescine transport system permease protein